LRWQKRSISDGVAVKLRMFGVSHENFIDSSTFHRPSKPRTTITSTTRRLGFALYLVTLHFVMAVIAVIAQLLHFAVHKTLRLRTRSRVNETPGPTMGVKYAGNRDRPSFSRASNDPEGATVFGNNEVLQETRVFLFYPSVLEIKVMSPRTLPKCSARIACRAIR